MNEAFGKIVLPIFRKMLDLRDRLEGGEPIPLEQVQQKVVAWIEEADRRVATDLNLRSQFMELGSSSGLQAQFGARYAIVAWIDELLTKSTWGRRVNWGYENTSLEWMFYKSLNYADWFYDSAEVAKKYDCLDALEVHLLCVTMGFQGKYRHDPNGFNDWIGETYSLVSRNADSTNLEEGAGQQVPALSPRLGGRLLLTTSILISISAVVSLLVYFLSVHWVAG